MWAKNCPENFANRYALVSAELARIEGRELEAEELYEQAMHPGRGLRGGGRQAQGRTHASRRGEGRQPGRDHPGMERRLHQGVAWYKITYQIVPRRSEDYFSPAALVGEGIR